MVAIYVLWHSVLVKDGHRPIAEAFLARHAHHLDAPTMTAFVVGLLTNELPDWSPDDWIELASRRRADRLKEQRPSLPASLDAALQVCAAERLISERRGEEALPFVRQAVEELPGNEDLMEWEERVLAGKATSVNLRRLTLGLARERGEPEPDSDAASASDSQGSRD